MISRNPDRPADATRGEIVDRYTETVDTMPTILEWIGAEIPRQCDGRSLLDFTYGTVPADWRTEVHYEFDFRDIFYSKPEGVLGTAMDQSRSEEHTSELQSLMRISYAVVCLKKKK